MADETTIFPAEPTTGKLPATVPEMYLATVNGVNASGVQITIDGASEPMNKRYKQMATGQALTADDRVLVMKLSGTYVVLGKI